MSRRHVTTSYLLLLSVAIFWGVQFTFNHLALTTMTPTALATWRSLFGAITLIILVPFFTGDLSEEVERVSTRSIRVRYLLIALFEVALPFHLLAWGQQNVDSSVAAVIFGIIPLFTAFIVSVVARLERFMWGTLLSTITGFIGLVILLYPSLRDAHFDHLLAQLAVLGSAMSVSIALVLVRSMPSHMQPVRMSRNILIIATVLLLLYAFFTTPSTLLVFDLQAFLSVIVLGAFCTGLTYLFFVLLIRRGGATFASLVNYLVPLVGAFLGVTLLGNELKLNMVIALIVILGALVLHKIPMLKRPVIKRD